MKIKKRSKTRKWITISILTIAILGIGTALIMRPARTSYESVTAKIGNITTYYSFSGNVETKNRQTVMSEKLMQISKINVEEGDIVKEGDILMKTTTGDEILAKIDGEVAGVTVEENAQVMAGIKLMEIIDYKDLDINVKVDEYDLSAVKVGKETSVKIGAIDKEIKGKISHMSKEGQVLNGVTFFIATIDLAPDSNLRVGMSAEVKLISDQVTGAVTLPMTVIQFDDNNLPYVLIKGEKGAAVKTRITTGINDGSIVEIKSGVAIGDTILYPSTKAATGGFGFGGGRNANSNGGDNK